MSIPQDEWTPWFGKKLAKGWRIALGILADGEWHDWDDLIPEMMRGADLAYRTCYNILYRAQKAKVLYRKGAYSFVEHRGRLARLSPLAPEEWLNEEQGSVAMNGANPRRQKVTSLKNLKAEDRIELENLILYVLDRNELAIVKEEIISQAPKLARYDMDELLKVLHHRKEITLEEGTYSVPPDYVRPADFDERFSQEIS